jgi:glycolate oxidase FAD binding subunit
VLGRHRQWLPIDGAGEQATVGGAVATNDAGPLRHRYGTPRDLLIGIRLATPDGRLVKAGGNVVKNVAGYDLGKLVSGSFGSFAAIISATFKLLPVPVSSQTLSARFDDRDTAAAAAARIAESQLEPLAVELVGRRLSRQSAPYHLLVRFGTSPAAAAAQVERARTLAGGGGEVLAGEAEAALWRRHQGRASASAGTVVRLSWLPAALPQVLAAIEQLGDGQGSIELVARAGAGVGLARLDGGIDWQASTVDRLRSSAELTDVTIQDAPPDVKAKVDAWGPPGPAGPVLAAIKRALDPAGILNASRGPV